MKLLVMQMEAAKFADVNDIIKKTDDDFTAR